MKKMLDLPLEDARSVVPNVYAYYEVIFNAYVTYSLTDEICSAPDKSEVLEGNNFCEVKSSKYRDFVMKRYNSDENTKCYKIFCANQIIEVVSLNEPVIIKYINRLTWLPYPSRRFIAVEGDL